MKVNILQSFSHSDFKAAATVKVGKEIKMNLKEPLHQEVMQMLSRQAVVRICKSLSLLQGRTTSRNRQENATHPCTKGYFLVIVIHALIFVTRQEIVEQTMAMIIKVIIKILEVCSHTR